MASIGSMAETLQLQNITGGCVLLETCLPERHVYWEGMSYGRAVLMEGHVLRMYTPHRRSCTMRGHVLSVVITSLGYTCILGVNITKGLLIFFMYVGI